MNLIFDIGYYDGGMSKAFLDIYPDAKIVAVEPNIESINKSTLNDKITILNYAASSVDNQIVKLYIGDVGPVSTINEFWRHSGRFANMYTNGREVEVRTVTLDTLIDKFGKPDYIKIDAEGHELDIIKGLTQNVPLISFEWTAEDFETKTIPLVEELARINMAKFAFTYEDKMIDGQLIPSSDKFKPWTDELIFPALDSLIKKDDNAWGMIYCS